MVTIDWLIHNSGFDNITCVAGKENTQTEISGVHVMDNPDTVRFFRDGEMVLTTGFALKEMSAEKRREMIHELGSKNCSGIALKINRYFKSIPNEILESAQEEGIPVVQIPYEYSMAEVEYKIMHQIFTQNNDGLAFANDLYSDITKCVLTGSGMYGICSILKRNTNFDIAFLNEFGMVVATADNDLHIGQGSKLFQTNEMKSIQTQFGSGAYVIKQNKVFGTYSLYFRMWEMRANDTNVGYFCFISKSDEDVLMHVVKAIEYVLPLLQIEMLRFKTTNVTNIRAKNELLEQILLKKDSSELSTLLHCCELFGFRTDMSYLCLVWEEQSDNLDMAIKNILQQSLEKQHNEYFVGRMGENTVCILGENKTIDEATHIRQGENLVVQVEQIHGDGLIRNYGIGISVIGIDKIWKSYENALLSLKVNKVIHNSFELSRKQYIAEMIYSHFDDLEVEKIYKVTFAKLRKIDAEKNTNLVETLICYLKNDFSVKETSEELFIHRNTLNQRLLKIQEILGELKGEKRVIVMIGMIAMQIVEARA